jgi:formiminotetrahydrofolate cyclodeaminase
VQETSYLELPVDEFLARLAASDEPPGGGSAAAITVAAAAGLVAMVARCSRGSWPEGPGVAAQALDIQRRVAPLVQTAAEVWDEALAALGSAGEPGSAGDIELEHKLVVAAAVPLEIARLGADVACMAVDAAERCEGAYHADAAAAAALAAGGTRAAVHLVEVNLAVREGDEQLKLARAIEQEASDAAARALRIVR